MKIGRGTAWALRWFAKPVVTGSIPATASTFFVPYPKTAAYARDQSLRSVLEMMFAGVGGSEKARKELRASAYNKRYEPPEPLIWLAMHLITHLRSDRDKWKEKAITLSKEISAVRRNIE